MIASSPFTALSSLIDPTAMEIYVVVMFLFVVGGTLLDVMHKKSAQYFFENAKRAEKAAKRTVGSAERRSLLVKTVTNEVLTSSEFANPQRRMSHLLMMYGFVIFVATTVILIFAYTGEGAAAAPGILALLWHLGALMICVGGYWFWFVIRVDVSAEGNPWYRLVRADLFIVSLILMATFALIWSFSQSMFFFGLFLIAATTLFTTVLWSKFAHMFFKPAAAYQKKITKADGSNENLPADYDLTDPAVQAKYPDIPEYMGANPPYMGLGIKREPPRHY